MRIEYLVNQVLVFKSLLFGVSDAYGNKIFMREVA